jgi:hypothetical protein
MMAALRRLIALAVGIALASALAPMPAAAQSRVVGLVVYAPEGAPASRDQIDDALGRAASADGWAADPRPFAHAATALDAGAVPRERLDRFARAEDLAAEGWRAYLAARPTTAVSRLGDARAEAAALLDLDGGLELYADLSVRIGAARLALGRDDAADEDFRLAARLDPEHEVTDAEFKPAVVQRYAAARAGRPVSAPQRIESEPAGAAIEVDGGAVGRAPVTVDLAIGHHVVVARAGGRVARAEVIDAAPGAPVLRLDLDPDPGAAAVTAGTAGFKLGREERAAAVIAGAVLAYGDLDALFLVGTVWRRGAPALLGQICRGRVPARCGRVIEIGYARPADLPRAAARLWRAARAATGRFPATLLGDARLVSREPGPGASGAVPGGGERRRWWRSPWLWVGLGSAALAVTAGFLVAGDDAIEPVVVGDPCGFGGCE